MSVFENRTVERIVDLRETKEHEAFHLIAQLLYDQFRENIKTGTRNTYGERF